MTLDYLNSIILHFTNPLLFVYFQIIWVSSRGTTEEFSCYNRAPMKTSNSIGEYFKQNSIVTQALC